MLYREGKDIHLSFEDLSDTVDQGPRPTALHKQNNFPDPIDSINLLLYAVSKNFPFLRGKETTSPHVIPSQYVR